MQKKLTQAALQRRVRQAERRARQAARRVRRWEQAAAEARRQVAALRQDATEFRVAQRLSRTGHWTYDLATDRIWGSPEMHRIYGYPARKQGYALREFLARVHPDDLPAVLQANERLIADGKPCKMEFRIVTRAGAIRILQDASYARKDATGKVVSLSGASQDITRQKQVEVARHLSEMKFRALFENAGVGIALAQTGGQLLEVNAAYAAMLGYTPEELRSVSFADLTHPEDLAREQVYIREIRKGQRTSYDMEKRYFRKDRTTLWVQLHASFIPHAGGMPAMGIGVVQDISARKASEAALRASESRWRMALDAGHMAAWETNLTTGENFWDHRLAALLGLPADQAAAVANRWLDVVHPADRQRVQTELAAASQEGAAPFNSEFRVIRADGAERWLHDQGMVIQQPNGVRLMRGVVQDITARKRLEEHLRLSEATFRALFENAGRGIVLGDMAGRVILCNPGFAALTGYSPDEVCAMPIDDLIHPADLALMKARIREIQDGQRSGYEDERRYLRKDGTTIWVHASAGVVRDAHGKPIFGVVVVEDITDRRQAREWLERQVADRTAELQRRSRQLAELAAELTLAEQRERWRLANHLHDHLQQILVGTRMQLAALEPRPTPHARGTFDALNRNLTEAIEVTRNITQELAPPVAMYRHLPEAFHWLAGEMHKRHKLVTHCRIAGRLTTVSEAKSVLLYTAARELLLNVVKHAGTRHAELRLRRIADAVVLEIRDAGCGFDPAALDRKPGLGFGLFSIRERVKLLGGRFTMETAPGRGTRVVLSIPTGELSAGRKPAARRRASATRVRA